MKKIILWSAVLLIILGVLSWLNPWDFFSKREDLFYKMNGANLNTMNSYIVPDSATYDPETYHPLHYQVTKTDEWLSVTKVSPWSVITGIRLHVMSTYPWYIIMILLLVAIWYRGVKRPESQFGQILRIMFEGVYGFFEDILGIHRAYWIKQFVVGLFFVILISNLFGLVNDIIRFFAPQYLRVMTSPTGEFESTIAFAVISIAVTLYAQAKALWWWRKLLHEFIPITGKWLIEGKWIAKIWDIVISMFTWLLDIVGTIAKVISLSIRLLWNMSSGSILLNVIFIGIGMVTVGLIWFNAPIGLPIVVYIQSLLWSVIQAFVFALLVGIGIAMAQGD
jgi:F0F1-type ATP synthase membrane subunit a